MKKILFIFLVFSIGLIGVGCRRNEVGIGDDEGIVIADDEEVNKEDGKEDEGLKEGIPSPLSGIYASKGKVSRRPVAVMFDNHPRARWQAGLSEAEVVYEFMVEAPYTRYMGIFLINDPEELGPIRSSRPYFVTTLLEYDPIYVRVGGSEEAKKDIKTLGIADIDGLSSSPSVFYRNTKNGKKKPHNLYTSMNIIRKTQAERGYKLEGNFEGFKFFTEDTEINGFSAKDVTIIYNNENNTQYVYDEAKKNYKRYKDGKLHIDEYYNIPIVAKNIVIQEANTKVVDKEGRLKIDLIGSGNGIYITNGQGQNITWTKNSRNAKTKYYDESGREIKFNSGITWIQVINTKTNLAIK